jgi:signal transduction histidine kinase
VFEPGFSTKNEDGVARGLGLGLFLSAHTIESCNGRIDLQSEVGRGTTVTVRLPLEESNEDAPTPNFGH